MSRSASPLLTWRLARVAAHACAPGSVANNADLVVLAPRNRRNALGWTERLGVPKLDLGSPHGASNMNPVVVGGPLERLARIDRAVHLLLLLAVVLGSLDRLLALLPLSLLVLFRLLLGRRDLGSVDEIVLGKFHRAQHAFVLLDKTVSRDPHGEAVAVRLTIET